MTLLERAVATLARNESPDTGRGPLRRLDPRAVVAVALSYLVAMLSVPVHDIERILLFGIFPVLFAAAAEIPFGSVARRSVVVLPVVAMFGAMNIFYDREPGFTVGDVTVTQGVVSFAALLLRALWSVSVAVVTVAVLGVVGLCRTLEKLGLPGMFATQILLTYRYLRVILEEAQSMLRARDARSFGRGNYPLRLWAVMVGQLALRTFARGERVNRAMVARGFDGAMPEREVTNRWRSVETLFVVVSVAVLALMRWL